MPIWTGSGITSISEGARAEMGSRRVLVTGARGFVGPHLVEAVRHGFHGQVEFMLTGLSAGQEERSGAVEALDVTDRRAVFDIIGRFQPTDVVHLAGLAAIPAAAADPGEAWRVHVNGTLNIAHAILDQAPNCMLLFIGSGQVYGGSASRGLPLDENTLLAPVDDYSVTKAAADLALGALARHRLRCLRMRPFNHTGPGQSEAFVVPSFAMQIARIEKGLQAPVIRVGNLDAERDFLDVRDVASAYAMALLKGASIAPGTILNLASGIARRVRDVLDRLIELSGTRIKIELDPKRLRPSDLPHFVGDAAQARALLGWIPEYDFDKTLADTLADCRRRVSSSQ